MKVVTAALFASVLFAGCLSATPGGVPDTIDIATETNEVIGDSDAISVENDANCELEVADPTDPASSDTEPANDSNNANWGTGTCAEIVDCVATKGCKDASCIASCRKFGTQAAANAYDALVDCTQEQCPGSMSLPESMLCVHQSCRDEDKPCARVGTKTCSELAACVGACPGDDSVTCFFACFEAGTYEAQTGFLALNVCQGEHCSGLSDPQWSTCVEAHCSNESATCPI